MRITKRQLRKFIQEAAQLTQRRSGRYAVDVSAIHKSKPIIADWVDLLFDEMKETAPQVENIPDKHRPRFIEIVVDGIANSIMDTFGTFVPLRSGEKRLGVKESTMARLVVKHTLNEIRNGNIQRYTKRLIREDRLVERAEFAATAEEEAIKINTQAGPGIYGMELVTDQAFWEERGISTGEELALSVVAQSYSDFHKSVHGFRPRHSEYKTVEEYSAAIDELDEYYASMVAQDELDAKRQEEAEKERQELAAMMPGEFDFEELPKQAGMGRR